MGFFYKSHRLIVVGWIDPVECEASFSEEKWARTKHSPTIWVRDNCYTKNWNSNWKPAVNELAIGSDWQEINIPGFVMDTGVEEFVIDGGNHMPAGSYAFKMDDYGNITILRRWWYYWKRRCVVCVHIWRNVEAIYG